METNASILVNARAERAATAQILDEIVAGQRDEPEEVMQALTKILATSELIIQHLGQSAT